MGIPIFSGLDRPLKKAHLPTACPRHAFKITALDALEDFSRSKRGGYDVPPKVVFARRFIARRSAELTVEALHLEPSAELRSKPF